MKQDSLRFNGFYTSSVPCAFSDGCVYKSDAKRALCNGLCRSEYGCLSKTCSPDETGHSTTMYIQTTGFYPLTDTVLTPDISSTCSITDSKNTQGDLIMRVRGCATAKEDCDKDMIYSIVRGLYPISGEGCSDDGYYDVVWNTRCKKSEEEDRFFFLEMENEEHSVASEPDSSFLTITNSEIVGSDYVITGKIPRKKSCAYMWEILFKDDKISDNFTIETSADGQTWEEEGTYQAIQNLANSSFEKFVCSKFFRFTFHKNSNVLDDIEILRISVKAYSPAEYQELRASAQVVNSRPIFENEDPCQRTNPFYVDLKIRNSEVFDNEDIVECIEENEITGRCFSDIKPYDCCDKSRNNCECECNATGGDTIVVDSCLNHMLPMCSKITWTGATTNICSDDDVFCEDVPEEDLIDVARLYTSLDMSSGFGPSPIDDPLDGFPTQSWWENDWQTEPANVFDAWWSQCQETGYYIRKFIIQFSQFQGQWSRNSNFSIQKQDQSGAWINVVTGLDGTSKADGRVEVSVPCLESGCYRLYFPSSSAENDRVRLGDFKALATEKIPRPVDQNCFLPTLPDISCGLIFGNLTNNTIMRFADDFCLKKTDELCIDGFSGRVLLNGVPLGIESFKDMVFPTLEKGENRIVLMDNTSTTKWGKQIKACITYNKRWI